MGIRTDLALESAQAVQSGEETGAGALRGISQEKYESSGFEVTTITIETEEAARLIEKPCGRYITIETRGAGLDAHPDDFDERVDVIAAELVKLCGGAKRILVAGLGNEQITPDSLGPKCAAQVFATRHIKALAAELDTEELADVAVLATGVLGQTGVEASEIVKAVADRIHPEKVVVIDALACSEVSHLGTTIQLTDTGISPGSGVENARKELSRATLGVDVVVLGVPTVVDMQTIAEQVFGQAAPANGFKGMMVTPRSIDKLIDRTARLVSMGINRAFQPGLTIEELTSIVS
ncbi:MAG: GPR endopeptidase [Oscillospiraceae bacterium]